MFRVERSLSRFGNASDITDQQTPLHLSQENTSPRREFDSNLRVQYVFHRSVPSRSVPPCRTSLFRHRSDFVIESLVAFKGNLLQIDLFSNRCGAHRKLLFKSNRFAHELSPSPTSLDPSKSNASSDGLAFKRFLPAIGSTESQLSFSLESPASVF